MNRHPEEDLLSAWVDGEVPAAERAEIEAHLRSCARCRAHADALRATVHDMRALAGAAPDERDAWAIRSAVARARKRPERAARLTLAAGSAAALIIAVVVLVARSSNGTHSAASARGPGGHVAFSVEDRNYDATSAGALLGGVDLTFGEASSEAPQGSAGVAEPAPAQYAGVSNTPQLHDAPPPALAPRTATPAEQRAVDRCDAQVRASTQDPLTIERAILARYRGTRSILFVYSSARARELWVVREADCYVELFRQGSK